MCLARAFLAAALVAASATPATPAGDSLPDGWEATVPIPHRALGAGDRYVVWVEGGWLRARRESGSGATDWQVVLARASDPTPPAVSAPEGTVRFEVSYRGGRYFVREDANVLRCLRERKPDEAGSWPALPPPAGSRRAGPGGPRLAFLGDGAWVSVAAGPAEGRHDVLLRLAPERPGLGSAFEGMAGSTFAKVSLGEDRWVMDDGELLVAQRTLEALFRPELKPGDPAPALEAKGFDGRPIALADFRGKFVLLDFWATWCGPCIAELPHLEAVHREFGRDDRFVMLGLSLDEEADAPREFLEGRRLPWAQAHLGNDPADPVHLDFGLQAIPRILLIGPDGRVAALDLRGEAIRAAVAEALGRP